MDQPSQKHTGKQNRRLAGLMRRRDFVAAAAGLGFLGATPSQMFAKKPNAEDALEICYQVLKLYAGDIKEITEEEGVKERLKARFRKRFEDQIDKEMWAKDFDYVLTNAKMMGIAARRYAHQAGQETITEATLNNAVDAVVDIAQKSRAEDPKRRETRDAWCLGG